MSVEIPQILVRAERATLLAEVRAQREETLKRIGSITAPGVKIRMPRSIGKRSSRPLPEALVVAGRITHAQGIVRGSLAEIRRELKEEQAPLTGTALRAAAPAYQEELKARRDLVSSTISVSERAIFERRFQRFEAVGERYPTLQHSLHTEQRQDSNHEYTVNNGSIQRTFEGRIAQLLILAEGSSRDHVIPNDQIVAAVDNQNFVGVKNFKAVVRYALRGTGLVLKGVSGREGGVYLEKEAGEPAPPTLYRLPTGETVSCIHPDEPRLLAVLSKLKGRNISGDELQRELGLRSRKQLLVLLELTRQTLAPTMLRVNSIGGKGGGVQLKIKEDGEYVV